MSNAAKDPGSAVRDKSRADSLYQWAKQASESTNPAGRDVLERELGKLNHELEAFQLAKVVSAL